MAEARSLIEAQGEEAILAKINGGLAQSEVAAEIGVSVGSLNGWLHENPERSARVRVAMASSAETWLDRGYAALRDAPGENAEIARARAIEQHCARRAAIRDPKRYGDKLSIGGADYLPPIKTMTDAKRTKDRQRLDIL